MLVCADSAEKSAGFLESAQQTEQICFAAAWPWAETSAERAGWKPLAPAPKPGGFVFRAISTAVCGFYSKRSEIEAVFPALGD